MADKTVKLIFLGVDKASGVAKGVGGALSGLGKAALIGGGVAVGAIAGIGVAALKLAVDAAPLADIKLSFESMAEAAGSGADDVLAAFKKQSEGMVTNAAAMEAYNQATMLVSAEFAETLPEAMGYLGKVSAATGVDLDYLLSSLTTGVGRLSPMILDNLNIQVDLNAAYEDWAESAGVVTNSILDNTSAMDDQKLAISKIEDQLSLAAIKQGEWTDKTKESTKVAHAMRVEELSRKLAEHREELANLSVAHGAVIASTEDLTASMTKAQQQEALTAQVMALLAENTAGLPDVTGNAATAMVAMKATMIDMKDSVGLALQPALQALLESLGELIDKYGPRVTEWIGKITTRLGLILPGAIATGIRWFERIAGAVVALGKYLFFTVESGDFLNDWLSHLPDAIQPFIRSLGKVIAWLSTNIPVAVGIAAGFWESTLKPALEAARAFITDSLVPAFEVVVAWLVEQIPVALGFLSDLWENTFKPALEVVWAFIQDSLVPAFEVLVGWLTENIPVAIGVLKGFWEDTLKPAFEAVWQYITDNTIPIFETLVLWLEKNIPVAIEVLEGFWKDTLKPALEIVWAFIEDSLIPAFEAVVLWLKENIPNAVIILTEIWEGVLEPALRGLWAFLEDFFIPVLIVLGTALLVTVVPAFIAWAASALAAAAAFVVLAAPIVILTALVIALGLIWDEYGDKVKLIIDQLELILIVTLNDVITTLDELWFIIKFTAQPVIDGLKGAFDGVAGAIQSVIGWIQGVIDKLSNLSLPDWLTPGSPTPFEMGLRGISSALRDVAREGMPQLEASFAVAGAPSFGGLSGNGNGNGGVVIHNHFGADAVRSERDIYRIAENQEKSFRLRGVRTL